MFRFALDSYEKSLGKDHEDTKDCARNLFILLEMMGRQTDLHKLLSAYPHIEDDSDLDSDEGDDEVDDEEDSEENKEESSD